MRAYYAIFFGFLLIFGPAAYAAVVPGTGCDSDYMTAMETRAWMEGKHDLEAAAVLITRPQSVMDVACFNGKLVTLQNSANRMFSDNVNNQSLPFSGRLIRNQSYFPRDTYEPFISNHSYRDLSGNYPSLGFSGRGLTAMDNTFTRVIRTGLNNYFRNNFYPPGAAVPPNPVVPAPPASICGVMNTIWNTARCSTTNTANYRTFQQTTATDPRTSFLPCNSQRDLWRAAYGTTATPGGRAFPVPATPSALGSMDDTITYLNLFNPVSTPGPPPTGCTTLQPIPTGLLVNLTGVNTGTAPGPGGTIPTPPPPHPDAFCPAPSCWYVPDPAGTGPGTCDGP